MRRAIIVLEIGAIAILCIVVFFRTTSRQDVVSILHTSDFSPAASSTYQYYFEPTASSTLGNKPGWATEQTYVHINNDTMNAVEDYPIAKPAGVYRIALLGDSFAYGLYLNTADNMTSQLEKLLNAGNRCPSINKIEVMNFGVPTFDIIFEAERFRLRAQKYNPDLVMWLVETGDFTQVDEVMMKNLQMHLHEADPDHTYGFFASPGEQAWLSAWRKAQSDTKAQLSDAETMKREWAAFDSFDALYQGPLYIFSLVRIMYGSSDLAHRLGEFTQSRPQTYLNLAIGAPWQPSDQVTPSDAHPTASGSIKIAQQLRDDIVARNMIVCPH